MLDLHVKDLCVIVIIKHLSIPLLLQSGDATQE